ncbi:MAG: hypothetical protein KC657_35735 [Myxococcales bacterium]|nr:hypothetical protein [Myxococcales bacterium]
MSAEPEVTAVETDETEIASRHLDVALCYENARRALGLARAYEIDGGVDDPRRAACLERVRELRALVRELRVPGASDRARPGLARANRPDAGPGLARVAPSARQGDRRSGTR